MAPVKTREAAAVLRQVGTPAPRPADQLERYRKAREKLEHKRRQRGDRFAYLKRLHD